MASINASTSSTGLISTGDASGSLDLQGNGTTGLTINSNGKVVFANTALSTASAGTLEYNGTVPFFTPLGTQRGVVPGMQYYRLESAYAGANSTSAQSLLGVGVTLSASTIYEFECVFGLKYTGTPTSHTVSTLFGGTATLNNISYYVSGTGNITGTVNVAGNSTQGFINVATATVITGAQTTAGNYIAINLRGTVSVNVGGTLIPQYQLSALPGAGYSTPIGSYFLIYPIGASGSNISVGTWA